MRGKILIFVCVALAAAAILGLHLGAAGIAGAFSDPVSGIRTQDETTYASSAVGLATRGGWMTPKVLGRFLLVKPPLLIWLAGLSMKLLGISLTALRMPVLMAGALATALLVLTVARTHSRYAAAAAGLLLAANPVWHTFSRVCYTDMLLALAMIAALSSVVHDPGLSRARTVVILAVSIAAGVMAKNIAGLLPVAVLLVFYAVTRQRPARSRVLAFCGLAVLLLAPWHLYQLASHPRWFWTDYVQIQLLKFGLDPPVTSPEGPVWFYVKRLMLMDPLLCLLAVAAIPSLAASVRRRNPPAVLLASWLLVTGAALLAFQYRNLPYLLYSIPPLAAAAAAYGPLSWGNRQKALVAIAAAAFCCKAAFPARVWGLPYGNGTPIRSADSLRWYAGLHRTSELVAVSADDDFYATTLPIPKIRYCFVDSTGLVRRYAPHYAYLGITVSTAQFDELDRWVPQFGQRLREWGLDSTDAVGTSIVANSEAEIPAMIATHPRSDFYLPVSMLPAAGAVAKDTHHVTPVSNGRFFLLALDPPETSTSRATWTFSENW